MKLMRAALISFAKKYRYILGLVGIQLIVFHNWIFSNRIFTFGDIGLYPPEAQKELFFNTQFFYTGNVDFGNANITASSNPFIFLYGLLGKIGINAIWSEKILFFYPIVFGVILTSYFLIRYLTKSERGACIGALVYSYNVYFLITLTGALYIALAYAFAPLIFLMFLKVLDQPNSYNKISFTLLAAWLGFIEFRIFYIIFLIMTIYFFFFLYIKKASLRVILIYLEYFIMPGILFILLNLFWVLPVLFTGALTSNVLFNRELFGDGYFDILNAFVVFHPWWTGEVPSIFVKQTASSFLYIFPILITALLFKRLKDRRVPIFFLIFLIGVFLTKQSGVPFESIYLWLYNHIPGFNAFRESSKFFVVSSLTMAILTGYFFSQTPCDSPRVSCRYRWFFSLSLVFIISVIFFNAKTIATGDIGTMFIPRDIPEEYSELNNFLSSQKEYSRVLWFPHGNRFGVFTNAHPAVSMLLNRDTAFAGFSRDKQKTLEDRLYDPFNFECFNSFLDQASIRYVVVPSNLVWDEVDSPWRDPKNYIDKLDKVSFLKKLDIASLARNNIYIYENQNYRPHIYLTQTKESLCQETSFETPDFKFETPTRYSLSLKNLSEPTYVNFSEKYDPDWKIRPGTLHWLDALMQRNYFLSENFHFESGFGFNAFLIDPEYIKQNFPKAAYTINPDGSLNLNLTLYFKPQSYYLIGLLISIAVFVVSIIFLGYSFSKKHWQRKKGI